MSYTTQQDILDFVEDNNVKFVRFAFCDIFGFQKNIAVLASDLLRRQRHRGLHARGGERPGAPARPVHHDHPALAHG